MTTTKTAITDKLKNNSRLNAQQKDQLADQLVAHLEYSYDDANLVYIKTDDDKKDAIIKEGLVLRPNVMLPDVMASACLARYLFAKQSRHWYRDAKVLDMGCGCGVQGLVMAQNGAQHVVASDIMKEAVENTQVNVNRLGLVAKMLVLRHGNLFEPIKSHLASCQSCPPNASVRLDPSEVKNKKPFDLIVFNPPFFCGDPLADVPVSRTMLSTPDEIRRFLIEARDFCDGPILMPFFEGAGEHNDPWALGQDCGYSVAVQSCVQCQEESMLQRGPVLIYSLIADLRVEGCHLHGSGAANMSCLCHQHNKHNRRAAACVAPTVEGISRASNNRHWGDVIRNSLETRPNQNSSATHNEDELDNLLRREVFTDLSHQIFSHFPDVFASICIYHVNDSVRKGGKIFLRRHDASLGNMQNVYDRQLKNKEHSLDLTYLILQALQKGKNPFYVEFLRCDKDSEPYIRKESPPRLRSRYEHKLVVGLKVTSNGDGFSVESPELCNCGTDVTGLLNNYLDDEERAIFFSSYLSVIGQYIKENAASRNPSQGMAMYLLPLWTGTRVFPIPIGSIFLFCKQPLPDDALLILICQCGNYLAPVRTQQFASELSTHAEHSAEAAIIARNMSHNIGSHVMARLTSEQIKANPWKTTRFLSYLQQRMDFIARVSTEWPEWREPVFFVSDLLAGFFDQALLIEGLVRDEGYTNVTFKVKTPGCSDWCDYKYINANRAYGVINGLPPPDFLVGIPGGAIGKQAFYGFLENAIRNSVKHHPNQGEAVFYINAEDSATPTGGEATVNGEASLPFRIFYHDNLSDNLQFTGEMYLVDMVKKWLKEPVIDVRTLKRTDRHWGLQEMKVYSRFLAYPLMAWNECHLIAHAVSLDPTTSNSRVVLGYEIHLQRSVLILAVNIPQKTSKESDTLLVRRLGVHTLDLPEEQSAPDFQKLISKSSPALLCVRASNQSTLEWIAEWLKVHARTTPFRVLIEHNETLSPEVVSKALLCISPAPFVTSAIDSIPHEEEPIKKWILQRHAIWLRYFAVAHSAEQTPKQPENAVSFNVLLYVERKNVERKDVDRDCVDRESLAIANRWVMLLAALKRFNLNSLLNVYFIADQAPEVDSPMPWQTCSYETLAKAIPCASMAFDNHGKLRTLLKPLVGNRAPTFYQTIGGQGGDENGSREDRAGTRASLANFMAFDLIANVPQGFSGVYFLMRLIESCLLRVLVIDERVFDEKARLVSDESNKFNLEDTGYRNLAFGGVYTLPFIQASNKVLCMSKAKLPINAQSPMIKYSRGPGNNVSNYVGICCEDSGAVCSVSYLSSDFLNQVLCKVASPSPLSFDVIVMHWGLIEQLASQMGVDTMVFLSGLEKYTRRIVITSGRGKPLNMDKLMPGVKKDRYAFVEFSVLETYLVREFAKLPLSNCLIALTPTP